MRRALAIPLSLTNLLLFCGQTLGASEQNSRRAGATGIPGGQAASKLSPSQIFSNASHSVVLIIASSQDRQQGALGSGFVVDQDRIVTNHHVVQGMSQAFVLFSDGKIQQVSEVVSDSPAQDVIILAADTGQRHPLPLGDEFSLREGDAVYAIGAPKGLELSFTNGIVSSFRRSSSQFLIQTTAPIAPGSSGGPLLDNFGRVVGVTTSRITDAPGIYFSVGIGDVRRLIRTPYGVTLSNSAYRNGPRSKSRNVVRRWRLNPHQGMPRTTRTTDLR